MQAFKLYASREAKMCNISYERFIAAVFWWVSVEYFGREASLEKVNFHEAEKSVLFQTEAICNNFNSFLQLVSFELLVALTLDYIDIVNWLLKLLLPLYCHTEGLIRR